MLLLIAHTLVDQIFNICRKSTTFWAKKSSTFVVFLQQAFRLTKNAQNAIIQA
jgi:hypothetical protein